MRELPIPFSAAMVQAILAGRKTQTRRLRMLCRPGDRLWVREAWRALACFDKVPPREIPPGNVIWYEADGALGAGGTHEGGPTSWGKLRPPMFMPRWVSRLQLEVTEVRGHQLAKITEAEIIAEGCPPEILYGTGWWIELWDSINGAKASWSDNPYVWAHSFRVAR